MSTIGTGPRVQQIPPAPKGGKSVLGTIWDVVCIAGWVIWGLCLIMDFIVGAGIFKRNYD